MRLVSWFDEQMAVAYRRHNRNGNACRAYCWGCLVAAADIGEVT